MRGTGYRRGRQAMTSEMSDDGRKKTGELLLVVPRLLGLLCEQVDEH